MSIHTGDVFWLLTLEISIYSLVWYVEDKGSIGEGSRWLARGRVGRGARCDQHVVGQLPVQRQPFVGDVEQ